MKLLKAAVGEIESCGVTWKSEEEFLKFDNCLCYYETFKGGSGVKSSDIRGSLRRNS